MVVNETLINMVKNLVQPNSIFVEVGCYDGFNSMLIAPILKEKNCKLFVVDWFEGCEREPSHHYHGHRPQDKDIVLSKFKSNIQSVNCEDICTIYQGLSWENAINFEDNSIDFCFIDACHLYESVKKDIAAYLPKVKKGGYLAGHDFERWIPIDQITEQQLSYQYFDSIHAGVIKAVVEKFTQDEITLHGDNMWLHKK